MGLLTIMIIKRLIIILFKTIITIIMLIYQLECKSHFFVTDLLSLCILMIIINLYGFLFFFVHTIVCHSNSLNSTISNQQHNQHKHHHHNHHNHQQQQQNQDIIPYFTKPIENSTTVLGRNALLECSVENLGPYKVAWLKMDSSNSEPTVLTIGLDTLFGERKYRVTQNSDRQWFLHIKHVRISDRGNYMCQVNAKNMISQVGHLDVQGMLTT